MEGSSYAAFETIFVGFRLGCLQEGRVEFFHRGQHAIEGLEVYFRTHSYPASGLFDQTDVGLV